MIDFSKLLSPEARRELEQEKAQRAKLRAMTADEFRDLAIHVYHNCDRPRDSRGQPMEKLHCYDSALFWFYVPEMMARVYGRPLPEKCPVCGHHIEWETER